MVVLKSVIIRDQVIWKNLTREGFSHEKKIIIIMFCAACHYTVFRLMSADAAAAEIQIRNRSGNKKTRYGK